MYMNTLKFAPVIVPPLESEANLIMWRRIGLEKSGREAPQKQAGQLKHSQSLPAALLSLQSH